jgi:hypothetical protein
VILAADFREFSQIESADSVCVILAADFCKLKSILKPNKKSVFLICENLRESAAKFVSLMI